VKKKDVLPIYNNSFATEIYGIVGSQQFPLLMHFQNLVASLNTNKQKMFPQFEDITFTLLPSDCILQH